MNTILAIVLSVLAALGGLSGIVALFYVLPTYRKLSAEARKSGAEASQVVAQGATILLEPLQRRVTELDNEAIAARQEVSRLRVAIFDLQNTLEREREASREERRVSQETIRELKGHVHSRDMRIKMLESRGRNGTSTWPAPREEQ